MEGLALLCPRPWLHVHHPLALGFPSLNAPKRSTFIATRPHLQAVTCSSIAGQEAHCHVEDKLSSSCNSQQSNAPPWDVSHSADLYRINNWGRPYFAINAGGHVCVRPLGSTEGSEELDLVELVEALKKKNIQLPMIIRFPDIFEHRLHELQNCFDLARTKYGYKNFFQGVFPVKCNNDHHLLDAISGFGDQFGFGLEAGSKPELLIAMTKLMQNTKSLLICNGYKDQMYIESALLARQLNINSIIVLEQVKELDLVLKASQTFGTRPVIGVRVKLSTQHGGHWGSTSGHDSKFGLTMNELVKVVHTLKFVGMLDCLRLLHFHVGSQIPSISMIKDAMDEGSHIYCELALMGAPMGYIDVGGGLGIDYDGTEGKSFASISYNMQNYADNVVAALFDACMLKGVPQPIIISESGRALASHQSVLVFDVLSSRQQFEGLVSQKTEGFSEFTPQPRGDYKRYREGSTLIPILGRQNSEESLLFALKEVHNAADKYNSQESQNDVNELKQEAARLFKLGYLSLEGRARVDALYDKICHRVLASAKKVDLPDPAHHVQKSSRQVYHINLSIFRSIPDMWAIGQVFPIMPLQQLNEKPDLQAVLADLTCDSDGKIDRFIGANGKHEKYLPVHQLTPGESYYLGLFLAGVYQEGMGNAHNLYGRTNVVYIKAKPACASRQGAGFFVQHFKQGDSMKDVLGTVHYVAGNLLNEMKKRVEINVSSGQMSADLAERLLVAYRNCLDSYTYLT